MTETERLTSHWTADRSSAVVSLPSPHRDDGREDVTAPQARPPSQDWVTIVRSIGDEVMSRSVTEVFSSEKTEMFLPRTPLGKRLLRLRRKAIEAGMKLLTEDEVLEEVRRRRGEIEDDETDVC